MNWKKFLIAICGAAAALAATASGPVRGDHMPQGALTGRNIALWHSHGRYFDAAEERWKWQRCRLFGTVEDLYTRSYVVPFLVPMLENAGAYVMMPRERDSNPNELVIDPDGEYAIDGYDEHNGKHKWKKFHGVGFGLPFATLLDGQNPFEAGDARTVKTVKPKDARHESRAQWSAAVPERGDYAVYVSYPKMEHAVSDVRYTVFTATGEREFTVDQTMGGGTWIYLGTMPFNASKHAVPLVSLTNVSEQEGTVGADAVRLGGGMGNVARSTVGNEGAAAVSGMPRWAEAARYWLQWAGMPDTVYANQENDYRDDIFCRPQWVNYMRDELGVPVDLVMAFHSDAGTAPGDSIVGTLGIYYTAKGGKYSDGRSRRLGGQLCEAIVNSVVNDVRAGYEPRWTKRRMRDASYIEARIPEVPTMLLELLSHQNFADMRYGLDPQFKFDVSRAVYKGILRFLADTKMAKYVVSPLAPQSLALTEVYPGHYRLSWRPQGDPLERTATADSYIIEQRIGSDPGEPFRQIAVETGTGFSVDIPADEIYSFRVIAQNAGGRSFPSETVAAAHASHSRGSVTVVNGFTRVSGPDSFEAGTMAGFGLYDPGVPMGSDLSHTGAQFDFDREAQWVHDDQPGFGASRANMETKPVWGNSFDNILAHGKSILAAGYSFDSMSARAFAGSDVVPQTVDLILGLQKETVVGTGGRPSAHRTFPPELRAKLEEVAAAGTGIMVSGSYLASDSKTSPSATADDRDFLRRLLGIEWRTDHATAVGSVSEVQSRFIGSFSGGTFLFNEKLGGRPYDVASPDAIYPSSAMGATIMRYDENQTPAAVAFDPGERRAVSFGFPLEAMTSAGARDKLIRQTLNFLNKK